MLSGASRDLSALFSSAPTDLMMVKANHFEPALMDHGGGGGRGTRRSLLDGETSLSRKGGEVAARKLCCAPVEARLSEGKAASARGMHCCRRSRRPPPARPGWRPAHCARSRR